MLLLRRPILAESCFVERTPPIPQAGDRRRELPASAIELEAGERLFREGSPASALYYVVAGTIRAEISSDGFEPHAIGFFHRGDVLGFTYTDTMLYTATAASAARFYSYPAELLLRRFARDPKAAERMTRSSVTSLARMLALLAIVRSSSPLQRVTAYLMTKVEAGELMDREQTTIEMDIARSDLATLLGIHEFAIDTSLTTLATAGLIRIVSATHIEVPDVEQLEMLSLRSPEADETATEAHRAQETET